MELNDVKAEITGNGEDCLRELGRLHNGKVPKKIIRMTGAGSNRSYYRLIWDNETAIGVIGDDLRENRAFYHLAEDFAGLNVPKVYGYNAKNFDSYIQEDLGDTSLFSLLHTQKGDALVEESMRLLARLQTQDAHRWESDVMCAPFGRRQILWDLNYFKYEFLKPAAVVFDEDLLEDDFERLANTILVQTEECVGFMYRDFQSRNVMVKDDKPYFIDFQGGRRGPVLYDAVSFLWQARADFCDEFRTRMLNVYADEYSRITGVQPSVVLKPLRCLVLLRTLQVLGAYGFRGLVEHKAHFIESIPSALKGLATLITDGTLDAFPELKAACKSLCSMPRFKKDAREGLTVRVFSFSYKKGYPEDLSGNGGGFMFDCRAMHNPGRYAEYKSLTGLDAPVREFLEERGEIQPFIANAMNLVAPAVERYLSRGFNSLQIGFGCTGGQHRSVYSAQAMGEKLAEKFPDARIEIIHREQNKHLILNEK